MHLSFGHTATITMLSAVLGFTVWVQHRPTESLQRPLEAIPAQLGNWHLIGSSELTPGVMRKLNASSYISRTYSNGQTQLGLFIAYYTAQRAGESMHSPKHCLPGAGWEISQHGTADLKIDANTAIVNRYTIQKGPERAATLYWYQSKGRIMADEYRAKAYLVWDGITKGERSGSIVRIMSADDTSALQQAHSFAELIAPEMKLCFGQQ